MDRDISVDSGEVAATQGAAVLRAMAIGSCVVAAAYDTNTGIGGMAHVMLPGTSPHGAGTNRTRYAGDAIEEMLRRMTALGAATNGMSVCLVGGGNILGGGHDSPGPEIVQSLIAILGEKGIVPVAMEVGGTQRRSCSLDVSCGRVTYTIGDSVERTLWNAVVHGAPDHEGHTH